MTSLSLQITDIHTGEYSSNFYLKTEKQIEGKYRVKYSLCSVPGLGFCFFWLSKRKYRPYLKRRYVKKLCLLLNLIHSLIFSIGDLCYCLWWSSKQMAYKSKKPSAFILWSHIISLTLHTQNLLVLQVGYNTSIKRKILILRNPSNMRNQFVNFSCFFPL